MQRGGSLWIVLCEEKGVLFTERSEFKEEDKHESKSSTEWMDGGCPADRGVAGRRLWWGA
jgi:hypothetical protein